MHRFQNERFLGGLFGRDLRLVPVAETSGALAVGLLVVGDGGLALLQPVVQLLVDAGKVEGLAGQNGGVGGHEADVGKRKVA